MEQVSKRLLNWASLIEPDTLEQAKRTSELPFIHPHLALMPDAHLGKGATVGSVIPTDGAIIPAAVGVDIGCGMLAVRTQFTQREIEETVASGYTLEALHADIASFIPLSAGRYNPTLTVTAERRVEELEMRRGAGQAQQIAPNWRLQLGSLGSGNHFIECSYDEEERVWLFLHSGSRGVGNKLATKHIKIAQELCRRWHIPIADPDLAYLAENTVEFGEYLEALFWAQEFARLNREEMMDRVVDCFERWIGDGVERTETIGCHHNYTAREKHWGKEVWLSRKGAISAKEGELGLIPGSMGDLSYVVRGLGNPAALCSSPHGAGRAFSRSKARKQFTRADLDERMAGVAWGHSDAFLDEHPLAYKRIDVVMEDAKDLVEPIHTLRQFVNVKGD